MLNISSAFHWVLQQLLKTYSNEFLGVPCRFLELLNLCPVHLPWKFFFCTGQNNFCPRQNIFVPDKNFCPRLKSSYLLGKRIENYFKLWKIFFPWLKSYFPSISQAKMYFFSLGQNFLYGTKVILSRTKIILSGTKIFCPGQKILCLGRWTGH